MKKFLILPILGLFLVSNAAYSALISGYYLDSSSNIVVDSANDLEWLQWSETAGMSIEDALAMYSGDGFFLATNSMMADLFTSFDLAYGAFIWDSNENTNQTYSDPSDGETESLLDRERVFVSLFGDTFSAFAGDSGSFSPNDLEYTSAFFGDDADGDGLFNFAFVYDDYVRDSDVLDIVEWRNRTRLANDTITIDDTSIRAGVALVRVTQQVSAPQTLLLLSLSLLCIMTLRRRN
jgi:hypothetical protein